MAGGDNPQRGTAACAGPRRCIHSHAERGNEIQKRISRRDLLAASTVTLAGATAASAADAAVPNSAANGEFRYCLNTSTIRTEKLGLVEKIEIAAKAGFSGVEPWISEIDEHVQAGGSLAELGKRIADLGLAVESVIGFSQWASDDSERRAKALEDVRRCMDVIKKIGGGRLAAPPAGATDRALNLDVVTARYRILLEEGERHGVVPQLEVWGFSQTLRRLSEAMFVVVECGHPSACVLPDVYHLYKGGSDADGLRMIAGSAMHCIHMNDYPADPPRERISDAHRIHPGDGVAPVTAILRHLQAIGFRGALSLELFNREYWKRDPLEVARIGLVKLKAAVAKANAD